jgi:hypothetical protein
MACSTSASLPFLVKLELLLFIYFVSEFVHVILYSLINNPTYID